MGLGKIWCSEIWWWADCSRLLLLPLLFAWFLLPSAQHRLSRERIFALSGMTHIIICGIKPGTHFMASDKRTRGLYCKFKEANRQPGGRYIESSCDIPGLAWHQKRLWGQWWAVLAGTAEGHASNHRLLLQTLTGICECYAPPFRAALPHPRPDGTAETNLSIFSCDDISACFWSWLRRRDVLPFALNAFADLLKIIQVDFQQLGCPLNNCSLQSQSLVEW